jgi:RNA polymerase sigma factor (sigma-70 family)
MEAGVAPRLSTSRVPVFSSPVLLRVASDARLVALIREGRSGAFEAAYDRHHRPILAFCRQMLGDRDEAEDAVQHTFAAAYGELKSSQRHVHLRPWLFAIARNRCVTILRGRREQPVAVVAEVPTEALAAQVQAREDLRELVNDLQLLPEEQRAALVLAELGALSHADIAEALGVPRDKVKALIFQARESLLADRAARETACTEIRAQLASGRGAVVRRANVRRHLRQCGGCREFRAEVSRQRRAFALLLPVVPTIALKQTVLGGAVAGGKAAGGALAPSAVKSALAKGIAGALLAGAGTGTVVVAASGVHVNGHSAPLQPVHHLIASTVASTGHQRVRSAQASHAAPVLLAQRTLPTRDSTAPARRHMRVAAHRSARRVQIESRSRSTGAVPVSPPSTPSGAATGPPQIVVAAPTAPPPAPLSSGTAAGRGKGSSGRGHGSSGRGHESSGQGTPRVGTGPHGPQQGIPVAAGRDPGGITNATTPHGRGNRGSRGAGGWNGKSNGKSNGNGASPSPSSGGLGYRGTGESNAPGSSSGSGSGGVSGPSGAGTGSSGSSPPAGNAGASGSSDTFGSGGASPSTGNAGVSGSGDTSGSSGGSTSVSGDGTSPGGGRVTAS